jgi:hypothetical protein
MATFAQLAFILPNQPLEMCIGYLSIVGGAILWWYGLTWLVDKIKNIFEDYGIILINRIIGSIVIIISIIVLLGTLFNLFTINY